MPLHCQNSDLAEKSINISPDVPDNNQDGQDGQDGPPDGQDSQEAPHAFLYILGQGEVLIFAYKAAKQSSDAPDAPDFISDGQEGQEAIWDAPDGIYDGSILINIEHVQFELG